MSIIDSKKLNQAIDRAKNLGIVELPSTIGDCDLVLRSLRSPEFTAALKECGDLPEEEYIERYQKAHLARSIVEINGVDLRSTRFVTVDEQDPATGETKKVKLELHTYLIDHLLNSWGKDAVDAAFIAFGEVLALSERKAKQGVTFIAPEETPEEKFRRLLGETKAAEKDLPATLLDRILDEQGLMRKSTAEEIKRAMTRTDELAREQEKRVESPCVAEEPEPVPMEPVRAPQAAVAPRPSVPDPHVTLQQAMAARRPPEVRSEQGGRSQQVESKASRAAQIAALEGGSEEAPDLSSAVSLQSGSDDVVEIRKAPVEVQSSLIIDSPPVAGVNPRFRPPQRA